MPASYKLKGDLLKMELVGATAADEVIATFVQAINDPKCPDPVAFMLDVRQSQTLETQSVPEIRRVAEFLGTVCQAHRRAGPRWSRRATSTSD